MRLFLKISTGLIGILAALLLGRGLFAPTTQVSAQEQGCGPSGGIYLPLVVSSGAAAVPTPTPTTSTTRLQAVRASVETDPVPHRGDAADDPAIWVHPCDPGLSTIIGTDKATGEPAGDGGLAVYDLNGKQLQYLADGEMNNVDLRPGFLLGGQVVTLVTVSNRTTNSIAVYRVNPATRLLEDVAARVITPNLNVYGVCMYRSPSTGKYFTFVNSGTGPTAGLVEQWELFATENGKVDARMVRAFEVRTLKDTDNKDYRIEGCVADDELGHLYLSEEVVGIWKYGAEPDAGQARRLVDAASTDRDARLRAEVEGLTIAYGPNGTGYLIASSQGNGRFAVYRREGDNAFVKRFYIAAGTTIDGVSLTDGIDITTTYLGPTFPQGVFVAMDHRNHIGIDTTTAPANQNFKLVPWQLIAP